MMLAEKNRPSGNGRQEETGYTATVIVSPDTGGREAPAPLETAFAYAQLGLAVLPLCGPRHRCKTPGKVPFDFRTGRHMDGWQQRGVPTADEIEAWLRHPAGRRANIGAVMGRASGLVRVDVDGPEGERTLRELAGGDPEPTWEFVSGRAEGGRGLLYALPEAVTIPTVGERNGLKIVAEGGQTVLPPSIHPATGRPYRWLPGRDPWSFGPATPAPTWLIEAAHSWRQPRRTAEEWAALIRQGAEPGARHPSMLALAGHLIARGVDPAVTLELLQAWNLARCKPPKPEAEVEAIVRFCWEKQQEQATAALAKDARALARRLGCSVAAAEALLAGKAVVA